ncbi:MAG: division/cell wall cluster transcriptional repressor MraZ [Tissierellia bacterium]|nr:division/cell wall cluster transcriptional repressor MraZ [Tissierellia bacterium]
MFLGEFHHNLDTKGRLIIPSKFRESLGDDFVMTKGLDSCLFVFPKSEWKDLEIKLKELPLAMKDARAFTRFFYSGATESTLDKQGRVLIPTNLREHSGLEKEAVIIGAPNRIEIWSAKIWNEYIGDDNLSYEQIAEHMAELGI